jgi:hypothetical protein
LIHPTKVVFGYGITLFNFDTSNQGCLRLWHNLVQRLYDTI